MSAEAGGDVPVGPGDQPRRLNPWVTGVALGTLAVLAAVVFWPAHGPDTLEQPEQSLELVVGRDMDFRAAARLAPRWERRLYDFAFSTDHEARVEAIEWYEEMVRIEGSPLAELYRIVLLAEDGQTGAVEAALGSWTPADEWAGRLVTWSRVAYGAERPSPADIRSVLGEVRRELSANWFSDRLVARLGSRLD